MIPCHHARPPRAATWGCGAGPERAPCEPWQIPPPQPGAGHLGAPGQPQARALGISIGMGDWLGWAGLGCGELETGATATSLWKAMMALGACHGILGQVLGDPWRWAETVRPDSDLRAMTLSFMALIFHLNMFKSCSSFSCWKHFPLGTF